MKKLLSLFLIFILVVSLSFSLVSCTDNNGDDNGGIEPEFPSFGNGEGDGGEDGDSPEIELPVVPVG